MANTTLIKCQLLNALNLRYIMFIDNNKISKIALLIDNSSILNIM